MKFFQNMTDDQIEVIAKWLEHQGYNRSDNDDAQFDGPLDDRGFVRQYCGDTAVRTLYENKQWLVFISVDSSIEVVHAIYKPDLARNESIELGYYEEIK